MRGRLLRRSLARRRSSDSTPNAINAGRAPRALQADEGDRCGGRSWCSGAWRSNLQPSNNQTLTWKIPSEVARSHSSVTYFVMKCCNLPIWSITVLSTCLNYLVVSYISPDDLVPFFKTKICLVKLHWFLVYFLLLCMKKLISALLLRWIPPCWIAGLRWGV